MKTVTKYPNMYEYFLGKGIELKFDEIQHWIDKKVVKGFRRVFFVNTFTTDGEIYITGKGLLGIQYYYAKLELKKNSSWFCIDTPIGQHRMITNYEIIVKHKGSQIWSNTVKPTGWYEALI